jgi:G3E family GTPase
MFQVSETATDLTMDLPKSGLPVTIVTGFLGSGKTTLLNHILRSRKNLKIAVLVNELGDIDIDSQLLISIDENRLELTNGCICCTINDDLVNTIYEVLEREEKIDYLVIETTGVADPLPIALTLLSSDLQFVVQLDSILTLLDSENFSLDLFNGYAALSQLSYGDILLLNKADLVGEEQLQTIEEYCREQKSGARILRCERAEVPLEVILGLGGSQLAESSDALENAAELSRQHLKNDGFSTFSFRSDRPLDLERFQIFLNDQLPDNVFRAKGILWFAQRAQEKFVFQLSGKRFTIDPLQQSTIENNQLVLIGKGINVLQIQQHLNNCLTQL